MEDREHDKCADSQPTGDEAIYRLMLDSAVDLIVRGDAARRRTYVSPSAREILGYEPAEMLYRHAYEFVHPEDLARVGGVFRRIGPEYPSQDLTFRMRRKDGSYVWVEGRYRHMPSDGGVLAVLRDITVQKQVEERLAEANAQLAAANRALRTLVHQDGLTGIANRRRFDEVIAEEWSRARRHALPLALVLLDVDYFKAYNDRYGHLAGDDCLRKVCATVADALGRPGDLAARYGGEEIAAVLPATGLAGAAAMAEHMRSAVVAQDIPHLASPFGRVTVSAGAASFIPEATDGAVGDLIEAADRALYQAKADGRNRVRGAGPRPPVRPPRPAHADAATAPGRPLSLAALDTLRDDPLNLV